MIDGVAFAPHGYTERYTLEMARAAANKGNPDKNNPTAIIGNNGHTLESANKEIAAGFADMITFGRPYISNPDLPERFARGIELAAIAPHEDWWNKPVGKRVHECVGV